MKRLIKLMAFQLIRIVFFYKKNIVSRLPLRLDEVRNILVVETALLGDVVASTPVYKVLAERFTQARLTLLIQDQYKQLLVDDPCVDSLCGLVDTSILTILKTIKELRHRQFDLCICVSPGVRNSLLALMIGKEEVCGYLVNRSTTTHYYNDHSIEGLRHDGRWYCKKEEHIVVRALKSLLPLGFQNPTTDLSPRLFIKKQTEETEVLHKLALSGVYDPKKLNVVFHPGASKIFRRWPADRFAQVADYLLEEFGDKALVVVIGAKTEESILESITAQSSHEVRSFSQGNLREIMILLKNSDLFIGNDSGIKYLADSFCVPMIELLGPLPPQAVGSMNPNAITLYHEVDCSPCSQQRCDNDSLCLKSISVKEVVDGISKLFNAHLTQIDNH